MAAPFLEFDLPAEIHRLKAETTWSTGHNARTLTKYADFRVVLIALRASVRDVPGLRFVSFSVDPATDTPEVLRDYASRFVDDRSGWLFLTGENATIRRIAAEGFLLPVQDGDPSRGDEAVLHSSRFVLVDAEGRVRGTYDVRDAEAMLALRGDLRRLRDLG